MVTIIFVSSTQVEIIKVRSSKFIIKSNAQRKWLDLGLHLDFMTFTILNLIFIFIFFESIINLRSL